MALPTVLFSSSSEDFKPQEFIKRILKVSELPQPIVVSDSIESYEWSFETKYYSTTVHLCTTDNRTIGDRDFAESVQAFIHFFDPDVPSSFELAKAWLPYLNHIEPDILMLVCNTSRNSDAVQRKVALEWCIKNAFELVELNPEQDSEAEDDDFPETTGIARIVQALHAHTWPNLDMKDSPRVQSSYLRQMMKEQHIFNKQHQISSNSMPLQHSHDSSQLPLQSDTFKTRELSSNNDNVQSLTEDNKEIQAVPSKNTDEASSNGTHQVDTDRLNTTSVAASDIEDILQLDSIGWQTLLADDGKANKDVPLSDSHADVDEFEQLFMKLKVMKEKAENLPPGQRKKYAEQVAISFWKAIGGDEDEIGGLDEDSG